MGSIGLEQRLTRRLVYEAEQFFRVTRGTGFARLQAMNTPMGPFPSPATH